MYIAVDFDGTVVDHQFPSIGAPVPGAIEWMKKFHELGAHLILYTMRSDGQRAGDVLTEAVDYLKDQGVQLFAVNANPHQESWTTSPKVYAHYYIDDAAAGTPLIRPDGFENPCVNWSAVGPIVAAALSNSRSA